MPRLSAWFIRTAMAYLALGITFGALLLWNKGLPLHPGIWRLLPVHIELMLVGWTLQLIYGIAFWILPRWRSSRGNETPVWVAFWLLNGGIWLVALSQSLGWDPIWLAAGRLAEIASAAAFAINAWPRTKALGA
ncbi:MAG TPA: cbb3-type cytochrome c oxidase subunit I [Caldilineae bacterium]|nr:cbb3-type cytochrome c oxidase subunit I [Caldilineae bacterium]